MSYIFVDDLVLMHGACVMLNVFHCCDRLICKEWLYDVVELIPKKAIGP